MLSLNTQNGKLHKAFPNISGTIYNFMSEMISHICNFHKRIKVSSISHVQTKFADVVQYQ